MFSFDISSLNLFFFQECLPSSFMGKSCLESFSKVQQKHTLCSLSTVTFVIPFKLHLHHRCALGNIDKNLRKSEIARKMLRNRD